MNEWIEPYGRRELIEQFGAATMDRVHLHWRCTSCEQPVADSSFYSVGTADYRSVAELEKHSRQALAMAGLGAGKVFCARCARPAELRAADYHSYDPEGDCDLVYRWTQTDAAPTLWRWDEDGYTALDEPFDNPDEEEWFADTMALRRAASRLESEGIEAALADIEAAFAACDGWWETFFFVPPLVKAGQTRLARAIAEAFVQTCFDHESERVQELLDNARTLLATMPSA